MSRSGFIKTGIILIIIAALAGMVPGISTLVRSSGTDLTVNDATQNATDVGSALSFLALSLPALIIGIILLIVGVKKQEDDAA